MPDELFSSAIAALVARNGHHDIVDVSVALCAAERGHAVLISDPDDVAAVGPRLALIEL
ncbi:MAG TPA: hypothetical protein VIY28_13650 [Pseudonocardiaceae bacterium]